ncbi:MAG TPA: hypothetical protein VIS47_05890 [Nitrosopumilus sp.]
MVLPIIVLIVIPAFLGIVYMPPFDMPVEEEPQEIPEEPDLSVLYYILMGIWTLYLIKILLQVKRKTFRITQKY